MKIPALEKQSEHYPGHFEGKVPKKVKMLMTVRPGFPFFISKPELVAEKDSIYDVWTNSHGAVSAIIGDEKLGLKPDEFEIVEWYGQ